jgi:hypothetical protein
VRGCADSDRVQVEVGKLKGLILSVLEKHLADNLCSGPILTGGQYLLAPRQYLSAPFFVKYVNDPPVATGSLNKQCVRDLFTPKAGRLATDLMLRLPDLPILFQMQGRVREGSIRPSD